MTARSRVVYKEVDVHITATTHNPAAAAQPAAAALQRLTPANVSAATLKAAASDGDGLTGTAALNDGDAAAQAARRNAVDVKV